METALQQPHHNHTKPSTSTLPSGNVTFVFTDIEGSTNLLRQLDSAYATLLCTHRQILRDVWAAFEGHEMGVEGDSFLVAFAKPEQAVEACIEGQLRLAQQRWTQGVQVRVRMGVHRGWAVPMGGEYISLAVHRAARVVAAAAGRQVLVTADVVGELPSESALSAVHLGRCAVRDFDEPVDLFGLRRDGVPMQLTAPAVRATSRRRKHFRRLHVRSRSTNNSVPDIDAANPRAALIRSVNHHAPTIAA